MADRESSGQAPDTSRPLPAGELAQILAVSLHAGCLLMENGANIARVEEGVRRTGLALGGDAVEVSAAPAGIVATVISGDEHRTRIQRPKRGGVRLSLDTEVGALVRETEQGGLTVDQVARRLSELQMRSRLHGPFLTAVAVGLGCGAFATLLGGSVRDFALVSLTSTMAQFARHYLLKTRLGGLLTTAIVALLASSTAWMLAGDNFRVTVAAVVLLLVPGAPLVSGTADLFRGDSAAGLARTTHALLTVMMIGAGVWAAILLLGVPSSGIKGFPGQQNIWLAALMGGVAAAGFAVLFDVSRRDIPKAALVGLLAIGVRSLALSASLPAEVANLLAGMAIAFAAEALSHRFETPPAVFAVPGYITLVPGTVFIGGILHLVNGDYVDGLSSLVRAQLILIAVAVGMGTAPALFANRRAEIA